MEPRIIKKMRYTLPRDLRKLLEPIRLLSEKAHLPVFLVGGCVRDIVLGRPPLDVDIVVEGDTAVLARQAARFCKAELVSHPQFLTHTLLLAGGRHVDIARARREFYPEPAVLPTVEPASLQDDLMRRDFSINAMAMSLNQDDFCHLWDPFNGLTDLRNKKIRILHSESFRDDPTRIFRAARFAGRFDYMLDWRTRECLVNAVIQQTPDRLSGARLREELLQILMEEDPRHAFRLLDEWGTLLFLVPHLKWSKSHELLFARLLRARLKGDSVALRLMGLLHSLPVPNATGCMGHLMFPQRTIESVGQALMILHKLRENHLTVEDVKKLDEKKLSTEGRFFVEQAIRMPSLFFRKKAAEAWKHLQESNPCLSGEELRKLGYKPGPLFSRILDALRRARWEGKLRTREEEIRFVCSVFPQGSV
jgi:tRNA nucleotidyltransferase (CCA-adding enzyme)